MDEEIVPTLDGAVGLIWQAVQHNQNRLFDARILFRIGKGLPVR